MGDLVERLRSADMNSQQRVLGSRIFGEAADEITRLRAALADAQAVGFAAGVEAAAKYIDRRVNNYIDEHGIFDWETGVTEFPGNGEEWVGDQEETAEAIRALTPPDATAAAARVLLPGMEQRHIDHMTSLGRDPEKYTSEYRMAAKALRAIAGDTP